MSGGSGNVSPAMVSAPGNISAPNIDINQAIDSILKSAEILVPALQSAGIDLKSSLSSSNALLAGYGDIANNAITQQQQLLGMTPVDLKGQQMQQQLQQIRQGYLGSGLPIDSKVSDLFAKTDAQVAAAVGLKDPAQRQAAYQQALQSFQDLQSTLTSPTQVAAKAAVPGTVASSPLDKFRNDNALTLAQANSIVNKYSDGSIAFDRLQGAGVIDNGTFLQKQNFRDEIGTPLNSSNNSPYVTGTELVDWLKQQKGYTGDTTAGNAGSPAVDAHEEPAGMNNQQYAAALQSLAQDFQYGYNPDANQAISAADITKQIQSNPEYIAQYDSGMQAIQRAAAAGGMASSGNVLRAASDFGSQLAGTVYGDLYNRTAALTGQAVGVTTQAASNQMQNAGTMYQSNIAPASARSSAMGQVGTLQGQTATNQAQLQMQASVANQQSQLQAAMANAGSINSANQFNAQNAQSNSAGIGSIFGTIGGGILKSKFGL